VEQADTESGMVVAMTGLIMAVNMLVTVFVVAVPVGVNLDP
jgi:hypothetical protein